MSLEYVILGWLNEEPMTGYDLNATIEISTQHFWSTSQSQIYRTLSKIEEKGWVTQEVILQESRPPRKVYHITDDGRNALKDWLSTFHSPQSSRIPFLIQVFFAGQVADEDIISVLEEKRINLKERLGRIKAARQISASHYSGHKDLRDIFYWTLTMDYGESSLKAQIAWVEKAIERIRRKVYLEASQK